MPVYGLDIETDTASDGLDPTVSGILAVAICVGTHSLVVTGPEPRLLVEVDEVLHGLAPGILVTWNGSSFDLPFLETRARLNDVTLGLRLRSDPRLTVRTPLPGHSGAYRGEWHGHRHLDAYRVYRNDLRRLIDVSCSLKSVARFLGEDPVVVDASQVHMVDTTELLQYVASDASLARLLALRRWATATPFIDQLPEIAGS